MAKTRENQDLRPSLANRVKLTVNGEKNEMMSTMLHPAANYDTSEKGMDKGGKSVFKPAGSGKTKTMDHPATKFEIGSHKGG